MLKHGPITAYGGNARERASGCNGTGLHWPDLDEDLSVIGIIEGWFGMP